MEDATIAAIRRMTVRGVAPLGLVSASAMGAQSMGHEMSHQVAALPYRFDEGGSLEVMLITSLGGRRWIPPKGNLIKGLTRHEAAAQEAFEEDGVFGCVSPEPLGSFKAVKVRSDGSLAVRLGRSTPLIIRCQRTQI